MPSSRVSSSGAIRKPTKKPAKAPTPEPTLKPAHSSYPMWEYRWHKKPLGARLMWCGPLEANEYKPDARQQIKYRIRLHAGFDKKRIKQGANENWMTWEEALEFEMDLELAEISDSETEE